MSTFEVVLDFLGYTFFLVLIPVFAFKRIILFFIALQIFRTLKCA